MPRILGGGAFHGDNAKTHKHRMIVYYTVPNLPGRELRFPVVAASEDGARNAFAKKKPHGTITRVEG